jgi:hypothetical protein
MSTVLGLCCLPGNLCAAGEGSSSLNALSAASELMGGVAEAGGRGALRAPVPKCFTGLLSHRSCRRAVGSSGGAGCEWGPGTGGCLGALLKAKAGGRGFIKSNSEFFRGEETSCEGELRERESSGFP